MCIRDSTGACTVNTVGGTHDFVELPTLAIAVLPVAVAMHHLSVTIGKGFALLFEVAKAIQKFTDVYKRQCYQGGAVAYIPYTNHHSFQ